MSPRAIVISLLLLLVWPMTSMAQEIIPGDEGEGIAYRAASFAGIAGFGDLITPESMDTLHFRFGVRALDENFDADFQATGGLLSGDDLDVSLDRAVYDLWAAVGILGLAEVGIRVPFETIETDVKGLFDKDDEDLGDIELSAKIGTTIDIIGFGGYLRGELPSGDESEGIGGTAQLEVGATAALYPFEEVLGFHVNVAYLVVEEEPKDDVLASLEAFDGAEVFKYRLGVTFEPLSFIRLGAYWEGQEFEGNLGHLGAVQALVQGQLGPVILEVGGSILVDDDAFEDEGFEDTELSRIWGSVGLTF